MKWCKQFQVVEDEQLCYNLLRSVVTISDNLERMAEMRVRSDAEEESD
ncbi:MAG: hypothetical protein NVS4B11_38110 [Ktedonobacteraceae bacterium]